MDINVVRLGIDSVNDFWRMREELLIELNIYTSPAYRKQRYARSILDEIIKYSAEIGIQRLWLNSSEKGHSLYLSYGFTDKQNEMELFL